MNADILDAGAGFGQYTYWLYTKSWTYNITAVDVKDEQVDDCNKFFGRIGANHVQFGVADLTKFYKDNSFDLALSVDVMEHIEDDSKELSLAYRALRSGGYLLLFVPALQWLFSEADSSFGHFRRYYKKDLVKLVEKAGFSIEKAHYFDLAGILPWYVNFVLLKNSFNTSSVAFYDKLVVPPMRVFENLLKPPIGKNILIVARKE